MGGPGVCRRALPAAVILALAALVGPAPAAGEEGLMALPEKVSTKVPAILEDHLADIEKVAAALPQMDRKKAYLITLPLQSYLEDVVLSANREVTLHPRAIGWLIGREAARGATKQEISRLLVVHYQRDAYRAIDVSRPAPPAPDSPGGNPP